MSIMSPTLHAALHAWALFCLEETEYGFNWYSENTATPEEDFDLCRTDAAAGVPAAVAKYTAYAAFRMKS